MFHIRKMSRRGDDTTTFALHADAIDLDAQKAIAEAELIFEQHRLASGSAFVSQSGTISRVSTFADLRAYNDAETDVQVILVPRVVGG